jgi:23S rRNA (cytosine1962-C5)-methyltransferase
MNDVTGIPIVYLKPGKEQSLMRRHPWVFSGAIAQVTSLPANGDTVQVFSSKQHYLGTGHWSDGSISVRIFSFDPYDAFADFWGGALATAYQLRVKLGLANNDRTTMYRLIHGEGDGLPGLIVDVYDRTAVVQAHSAGMYRSLPAIAQALMALPGYAIENVYDKSSDKLRQQTGLEVQNAYLTGNPQNTVCLEHGHRFKIDWEEGQKTGFFIDQRENRFLLGQLSNGKKVLNTFCYSGGFSVFALAEGASEVHSLDSSQKALDLTEENIRLNDLDTRRHKCIKADAVEYLSSIENDYDLIVLDPPAFAKHIGARHKAVQGYMRINEMAIRKIKKGGLLFTFSCSQAVDKQLFHDSITAAALRTGRQARVIYQLHQPADHPVSLYHPEGEYLKGLVIEIL